MKEELHRGHLLQFIHAIDKGENKELYEVDNAGAFICIFCITLLQRLKQSLVKDIFSGPEGLNEYESTLMASFCKIG